MNRLDRFAEFMSSFGHPERIRSALGHELLGAVLGALCVVLAEADGPGIHSIWSIVGIAGLFYAAFLFLLALTEWVSA